MAIVEDDDYGELVVFLGLTGPVGEFLEQGGDGFHGRIIAKRVTRTMVPQEGGIKKPAFFSGGGFSETLTDQ